MSTVTFSRAATSASCGLAKPVFISRSCAPTLPAAARTVTRPRWSRHSAAITEPAPMPREFQARARALTRSLSWANVTSPHSSVIAMALGSRVAALSMTAAKPPNWRTNFACRIPSAAPPDRPDSRSTARLRAITRSRLIPAARRDGRKVARFMAQTVGRIGPGAGREVSLGETACLLGHTIG